jgi:hypothetical protein
LVEIQNYILRSRHCLANISSSLLKVIDGLCFLCLCREWIKKVNPKSASSNPFITIAFSNAKNTKVQKVNSMLIEASANN